MSTMILLAIKPSKGKTTKSKGPCTEDAEGGPFIPPQTGLASWACDPGSYLGPHAWLNALLSLS